MAVKPWHKVVDPREDLREGRPQDASEFAVHLDKVREGIAPRDYQDPRRFFERTYLTQTLKEFSSDVIARLSGRTVETNAVFNLTTQFGGGKTHALTLVYHLARAGQKAYSWPGVMEIVSSAGVSTIPEAAIAIFVGTEFDSLTGRGGSDGTPLRKTPWGEIAFQLGGKEAFEIVRQHDERMIAPGGDVIRSFLPKDQPSLILMDEIINYTARSRKLRNGMAEQLHTFIHNLSETARSHSGVVLAISVPASELEMTTEDQGDYLRIEKLLERVGKAYIMSAKEETAEIIRRRLFDWEGLPKEAKPTIAEYADWVRENRNLVPTWFPIDQAYQAFEATYPFHPMTLSIFERKWQTLPSFQQTRGVLKLLALWISSIYPKNQKKGSKAPSLITIGSAPLDDPLFRAAVLKQIGEGRYEGVITTDICGSNDSHASRLDEEASEPFKSFGLHQATATTIFFESISGGEMSTDATLAEIRLAMGGPTFDIVHLDTVLEALAPPTGTCFFLYPGNNTYHFGLKAGLIKIHADRKAIIDRNDIHDLVKDNIKKVFDQTPALERVYFALKSSDLMDKPALTLAVISPNKEAGQESTKKTLLDFTKYHGESGRTYKSAIIWSLSSDSTSLYESARDHLAWAEINKDAERLNLDDEQKKQVRQYIDSSRRLIKERVWEAYSIVGLYADSDTIEYVDLGRITSSASESLSRLIASRLIQLEKLTESVGPSFLVRNWTKVSDTWSSRQLRDAFYALPQFPRVSNQEVIKKAIQRGVADGNFGYGGIDPYEGFNPFFYKEPISSLQVEFSDDLVLIPKDLAEQELQRRSIDSTVVSLVIDPDMRDLLYGEQGRFSAKAFNKDGEQIPGKRIKWSATGGQISSVGEYLAGNTEGTFEIVAECDGLVTRGKVVIRASAKEEGGRGPGPGPQPTHITSLCWKGTVDPFKWMNIYKRILMKVQNSGSLGVTLEINLKNEEGISKEKIDEVKIALKELGMDDELTLNSSQFTYSHND